VQSTCRCSPEQRPDDEEVDEMSKHTKTRDTLPRREFLRRSAGLVGAAGAGLVVASAHAGGSGAPAAAAAAEPRPGYRESEHVRRYYRMADF
jgi:nitrous oxide reductase